jgi:hypothetical protein
MNKTGRIALLYNLNQEEQQRLRNARHDWSEERVRAVACANVLKVSKEATNKTLRAMRRAGKTV